MGHWTNSNFGAPFSYKRGIFLLPNHAVPMTRVPPFPHIPGAPYLWLSATAHVSPPTTVYLVSACRYGYSTDLLSYVPMSLLDDRKQSLWRPTEGTDTCVTFYVKLFTLCL